MSTIKALNLHEQAVFISEEELNSLRLVLKGELITPRDKKFDDARQIWNAMINRKPAFIVQCHGTADVIAAVKFAKKHGLILSVKGAGHNIAGRALKDSVMLIDLSQMRSVYVDPDKKQVRVGPGATLADVDHETQAFGLALPVGINSTTGISGLTLGGGFGWLSRKYGMTVDNLLEVEVVNVDGERLVCNKNKNKDLFWAVRGGGGNFAIITSYLFSLQKVGPEVIAGPVVFDIKEARSILEKYCKFCKKNPDDFTVWAIMRKAPPFPFLSEKYHNQTCLIMVCIYTGKMENANQYVEALKNLGTPLGSGIGPHRFAEFQQAFDPLLTPGVRNYWKSHNFKTLDHQLFDVLIDYVEDLPSNESELFIAQMGGKTNTIDKNETAYPHRDVEFIMNVHTRWQDEKQDDACVQWARDLFKATSPFATGGVYVNFVSEGDDSVESAYGVNVKKLKKVKEKYDPDNRLRANLNINPKA